MAVECEKSVQALVTHLRCGVSSTQSTVTAVTHEVSKGGLGGSLGTKNCGPMVSISDDDSGCGGSSGGSNLDHMIYEWTPESLTSQQISAFFSGWPEEKIPYVRSIGADWRRGQLMTQLPLHDQDIKKCKSLTTADEKREMRMFIAERKRDALGQGSARQIPITHYAMKCTKCGGDMLGGEVAVYAVRAGHAKVWHPGCFQCDTCNELLIDLVYFWKDPHIYCGRHHAHTLKPRCSACDEIIFSDECTEAESNWWHLNHFCCVECDTQLGGNRYIMHQQQPYCIHCYESIFAQHCSTCKNVIGVDEGQMSYENQHWHATDTCFCCANCSKPLLGLPFLPKRKSLFCSLACNNLFQPSSTLQPHHTRTSQPPITAGASPQPLEAGTPAFEFQQQQTSAQFLPASTSAATKSTPTSAAAAAQLSNFKNRSLTDSDDSTSTTQTEPVSHLEKLAENLTLCSSNTLPKQLTTHNLGRNTCPGPSLTSPAEGLNNCNPNLTMTATTSWTHKTPSSTRPPLCQTSKTTTSPKNFVKPFNYIPPKTVSPKHQANKANNNNNNSNTTSNVEAASSLSTSLSQAATASGVVSKDEDNDSAVSSMTSSNVETPPVSTDIYSPPSLGEEPPPLPPKPAFMKGHSSPEKTINPNASTNEPQDTQTLIRVEEHVYTEASKAAKFQRSLPDLNKKKSNLKNKTLEEELCCVNSAGNAKIVSFNPNVRERTRSSSLPRCNSKDEFNFNEGSVVEPEYQFRKSHYKSRSKCSRRSSRHRRHGSQLQHYHQYYYHYKQHHYNHEYCSDPEECTGSERFSALPWEYYSDSSSSTSSSSDDDVSTPGFINPPQPGGSGFGTGSVLSGGGSAGAASSIQRQRRRHRRSKKNKCKIS